MTSRWRVGEHATIRKYWSSLLYSLAQHKIIISLLSSSPFLHIIIHNKISTSASLLMFKTTFYLILVSLSVAIHFHSGPCHNSCSKRGNSQALSNKGGPQQWGRRGNKWYKASSPERTPWGRGPGTWRGCAGGQGSLALAAVKQGSAIEDSTWRLILFKKKYQNRAKETLFLSLFIPFYSPDHQSKEASHGSNNFSVLHGLLSVFERKNRGLENWGLMNIFCRVSV